MNRSDTEPESSKDADTADARIMTASMANRHSFIQMFFLESEFKTTNPPLFASFYSYLLD